MASLAQSPLRYNSHHHHPYQTASANGNKSNPATATESVSATMSGTTNNQSRTPIIGNSSTAFPPPAHPLPPRPSLPPRVDQVTDVADNGLGEQNPRAEAHSQAYAQRSAQHPAVRQMPTQSGFFTGNLPLSNTTHGVPPSAGSFAFSQPGPLNSRHSLSHYFTGQGPFNSAPPPPSSVSGALPSFFTGGFPPPPPPPLVGGAMNTIAQHVTKQPPWRQLTDKFLRPSGQFPPPLPGLPHFAQTGFNMSQSQGMAPQPNGVPTPNGTKEKKKDPKIYLPAPIPTHQYLRQASLQAEVRIPPSLKLVILDLNGTLLYRPNSRKQPRKMIARPYLKQFLAYLFDNFAVMVWSSAKPENVNVLVEIGLEEYRHRLIACWARDTLGLEPKHYSLNVQCYKNLHRIWASNDVQRYMRGYESGARFDQRNTILVDDSSLKAAAQPHNLLEIPEFKGGDSNAPAQDVLSEVVGYLEVLKMQEDVSKFIHKDPFRANGDWRIEWNELSLDALQNHFQTNTSAR